METTIFVFEGPPNEANTTHRHIENIHLDAPISPADAAVLVAKRHKIPKEDVDIEIVGTDLEATIAFGWSITPMG